MALAIASLLVAPILQCFLAPNLTGERLAALRTLFVTLGGSMIGATAISFSVVMLAVQLNFARIPHALFRKLSQDPLLVGSFVATFGLAILLGSLSMLPSVDWAGAAIIVGVWCLAITPVLFLSAYRRALNLINPHVQLRLVTADVRAAMKRWKRLAKRMTPLFEDRGSRGIAQDLPRSRFFQSHPHWTDVPNRAVAYSLSFARRYAEQGEYDVSDRALATLIEINADYVEARGRTFFAPNPMFDNPLSSEGFINETLEQLRRLAVVATSRGDEEQTTQIMNAMAALVGVYAKIDYGRNHRVELYHAQLAASYLNGVAEGAITQFGPDVLMESVRLLGRSALVILGAGRSLGVVSIAEKIAGFSVVGIAKPNFSPVTLTGVEQLAGLTFALIRSEAHDVRYALKQLRSAVTMVARVVITSADTPLRNAHSGHMAPYYSLTRTGTLGDWLTELTNAVAAAPADDKNAQRIVRHINDWSDQLYQPVKETLLLALKHNSGLTIDLIMWICHLVKLLSAVAKAPTAGEHMRAKLLRSATWLLWVLDWIPNEKDTIGLAENCQVTEHVFEAGLTALGQGVEEVAEAARDILLKWAFKGGRHETGWSIFERALEAVAVLSVSRDGVEWEEWFKAELAKGLTEDVAFPREECLQAAEALRERADNLDGNGYPVFAIEQAVMRVDRARLNSLLIAVADLLVASQMDGEQKI